MRVVHVASGREWRGGQRQVALLAEGIQQRGDIDQVVITGRGTRLAREMAQRGVPLDTAPWALSVDPRVLPVLRRHARAGAIIHAHDAHAHLLANIVARIADVRVVVTRRVAFPIRHPPRWTRVAQAIALSRAVSERLAEAGIARARITVIPPAATTDVAPAVAPSPPLLVTIAALTPEKGIDVLLAALPDIAARHPDVQLVICGDGIAREALQRLASALGIGAQVTFAGHVERPEAYLDRATLMIQPSRSEGFGSTVLDALARGVPVVASNAGGLPDALEHGGGLLVPPGDAPALASAVSALLGDPATRSMLGSAGRAAVHHFAVSRVVSRTVDVYRSA